MVDFISLGPAVFGATLSLYNWFQTTRPANIKPNNIIDYAIVSSSYEECDILTVPLVFHNDGAYNGVINDIKVGLKSSNKIKYFEIMGRANLKELSTDQLLNMDMEKYSQNGYSIMLPNYPIDVYAGESKTVILIAVASHDEKIIAVDEESKWVVETYFGNKKNVEEFDFKISKDQYESAEYLRWFRSQ
ncbi:MAG: hypothetical protein ACXAD7_04745 [Candidatus Kariarchaeaceae archaeon]|jgi:hypothetical protein